MYKKQALYKTTRIVFILFSLFILMSTSTAVAASVTLRWDPVVPTPDGYRLYARAANQAFNYNSYAWSGSTTTCTINNLDDQTDYYFVVRAYDNGMESANSNQVYFGLPPLQAVLQGYHPAVVGWRHCGSRFGRGHRYGRQGDRGVRYGP